MGGGLCGVHERTRHGGAVRWRRFLPNPTGVQASGRNVGDGVASRRSKRRRGRCRGSRYGGSCRRKGGACGGAVRVLRTGVGPHGDCGLTGRKIIVDTYGGMARHGGGAFSGKDPSKVDRSAAYLARYVAKNLVAAGIAERCELQLSYAIGVAEPTSISIETFGTAKISDEKIVELVRNHFELRPKGLIDMLDLLRPIYLQTAAYGHFGREEDDFTWERTDKAEALKNDAGL